MRLLSKIPGDRKVFDKLREVGVLSYLLYLLFKCFVDG